MKRLIQISDCHLLSDPGREAFNVNPASSLASVLRLLKQDLPDVLLITGDISGDDTLQSYQLFLELLEANVGNIPWYVIPGNHDLNPYYDALLKHRQLRPGAPIALGNWQLHGIDTRYKGTLGYVSASDLNNVTQAIDNAPDNYHLLALHHHIKPSNSWMDKHCLTNAEEVTQRITAQPGLRLVIHGHIHAQSHYYIADCAIMGVPSTCWQWAMQPEFGTDTAKPGYREIQLSDDGNWTTTIRRIP